MNLDSYRGRILDADAHLLINLSGRGDKDVFTIAKHLGVDL